LLAHFELKEHDYPYFSSLFQDIITYEDNKDYFNEFMKEDSTKLIHNKIPLDPQTGKPIIDKDKAQSYHDQTKSHVPKNVSVTTDPFDSEAINFDKNAQIQNNIVQQSKTNLEDGAGINSLIFNNVKASSNVLEKSMKKDFAHMQTMLPELANIVNWLIKSTDYLVTFIDTSVYDKEEKMKEYRGSLAFGGSRLPFIASTGLEPFEFLQLAELEKSIDIDSLMPSKVSGNQLSGDSQSETGAHKKDAKELTDEGENTREKD